MRSDHRQVKELSRNREGLDIDGAVGQLVMYHADGGSGDAEKLALLATADLSGEERS